jgi:fibronectin type 3 domain-containing protein
MRRSTLIVSLLVSTLILLFSGCTGQPQPAGSVTIDKTLPQVHINGYLSDTDAIAFEWRPVTDKRVKLIHIYRDNPGTDDKKVYRIATIDNTLQTHYTDSGLEPDTAYRYRFTTVDAQGRESMPERTITAKTAALPEPVSFFTATKELARSAKLLWRPHPDPRVTGYDIERQEPGDEEFRRIDSIDGRLSAEYIDHDLEDGKLYRYRIIARTFDGKYTAPSKVVTVSTKPLPLPPEHVSATQDEIGTITLRWSTPATQKAAYFNVYRSEEKNGGFDYLAKIAKPRFTDKPERNGAHYFYKVTAVDYDGLESPPSAVVSGATKPAPAAPELLGVSVKQNAVVIRWKSSDARTVAYELVKRTHSGWFDTKKAVFRDLKTTTFTDVNVVPGQEYEYAVIAVDKDGLRSAPSESKSVTIEGP